METATVSKGTPQPPTQLKYVDALEYVKTLGQSVGVNFEDIPQGIQDECAKLSGATENVNRVKSQVNKIFLDWNATRTTQKQTFTPEQLKNFDDMIDWRESREARDLRTRITRGRMRAESHFQQGQNELYAVCEARTKLDEYLKNAAKSLAPEIEAIVKDGWFKYSEEETKKWNDEISYGQDKALVFVTPNIKLRYVKELAAIDMSANMGQYKVVYRPMAGLIYVYGYKNNTLSDGYIHPHVSADGSVCWGNANVIYMDSMKEYTPSKAFHALRVILESYNDESPYEVLVNWVNTQSPEKLKDYPQEYCAMEGAGFPSERNFAWIREEDIDDRVTNRYDTRDVGDDDGECCVERKVAVYTMRYRGTRIQVPDVGYFLRTQNSRYIKLDSSLIQGWSA